MSKQHKKEILTISIGAAFFALALALDKLFHGVDDIIVIAAYLAALAVIGGEIFYDAARGLFSGRFLDENFLMSIASVGAFIIGERPEAVLVMLLYRIGELLQSIAVGKSRDSVSALIDICPESVSLITENGIEQTDPDEVSVGATIVVRPGERVPIDGVVVEGSSSVNTAALTGESLPVDVGAGDRVASGAINTSGVLHIRTECEYSDSTVCRMLALIEGAAANKAKSEKFITRFARFYTPAVVALALIIALVPPLFFGGEWKEHIYRALNFLVISCPCALVISVPLTFFGGIGAASRNGILVKGSNCLETLASCGAVVFDKTGTLTKGSFEVVAVKPQPDVSEERLMELAAYAESFSTHPIAVCIAEHYKREYRDMPINADGAFEELAGFGVHASVRGRDIYAGSARLMESLGASPAEANADTTAVHIYCDKSYLGHIELADALKPGAQRTVSALKQKYGIKTYMLTGDRETIGSAISEKLGLDGVRAELLPEQKVAELERIMTDKSNESEKRTVAFVGDGINDAPVIARADVGFAMGALGSDAAIEAADIVLTDDDTLRVPLAVRIAKKTVAIARQNIAFALAVKFIVLILGALGIARLYLALVSDVGVCLIAILNAMRAMRIRPEDGM